MVKNLLLSGLFYSTLCYTQLLSTTAHDKPFVLPTFSVKLDTSSPIKIELPDFRKVGNDLGIGVGDFFSTGANSFAETVNSTEYSNAMSDGMGGVAKSIGKGMGTFNREAEKEFFPELSSTMRNCAGSIINPHNVFQFGGLVALSLLVTTTGYYLSKLIWEVITHKILNPKPLILLPETKYGRWDRFKQWWKGYKTPAMIFDESVKERLEEIEKKTKIIQAHNKCRKNRHKKISYDNLLLHGKPGTGKTLFARILSDRTDMDFVATTAASLLQSGTAGVKYFNDIMTMARKSSYGLILFIDEADALFVDRNTLDPSSDHYKVLSHILAVTGDGNSDFMLIAATNHAYIMDDAMGRRFQDRVKMPLPNEHTRKELINLYAEKFLFNTQHNDKNFIKTAKALLNGATIQDIVKRTAFLSHAEIKDMIAAIHKKACASQNGMITLNHINQAIEQAIEKRTRLEVDKKKKQKRYLPSGNIKNMSYS